VHIRQTHQSHLPARDVYCLYITYSVVSVPVAELSSHVGVR
jgi:hypothetical protein